MATAPMGIRLAYLPDLLMRYTIRVMLQRGWS